MRTKLIKSLSLTLTALFAFTAKSISASTADPLLFPRDQFTIETKVVRTANGEKKVKYRSYKHIPYVAKPVDKDYQSLNISVPVKIDDKDLDATHAPILFEIGVGGYMSVNNAQNSSRPNGGMGTPPAGMPAMGMPPMGNRPPQGMNFGNSRADIALAAGYVVVSPGCRGRDNKAADGSYYGKAPAAIVDLKAAVRYIRHNKGILPGNTDQIVSVGCSAGGAISALLGASGNSPLYDSYLKEIGAADDRDDIFGCACFSPITDLEHADGAYEWMYGDSPTRSGLVNQDQSNQLKAIYADYQKSLNLQGKYGYGILTVNNYQNYLLLYYLIPSANKYLSGLNVDRRNEYLAKNKWITWENNNASFSFTDYVTHVGRMKGLPAFDDFNMQAAEPIEFGDKTTNARHFTDFSLQQSTGDKTTTVASDVKKLVNLMNAFYFIGLKNNGCTNNWWLRNGASDNHTSQTVMINLATSLENQNKKVNTWLFWDGGHCADDDPDGFVDWIGEITGYAKK